MASESDLEIRASAALLFQGRVLSKCQVLGINSLKTVSPMPAALEGLTLESVTLTDLGELQLAFPPFKCRIDMARTGKAVVSKATHEWSIGSGPMPTIRLLFGDGTILDLTEPAKTKRISLRIESSP